MVKTKEYMRTYRARIAAEGGKPLGRRYSLERVLIERANWASALGNAGTSIAGRVDSNIKEINALEGLTDAQRKAAIDEQLKLGAAALQSTIDNPNPFATGRARTNTAKNAAGADAIARSNNAIDTHMESVRSLSRSTRAESARQTRAQIIQDALANKQLSVVIDGKTWVRKSLRSKSFTLQG